MKKSKYNAPRVGKKRWSTGYKKKINCSNPKGFSQKQYCKRKSRGGAYKSSLENIKNLVKLANHLDSILLTKEADIIDSIIFKLASDNIEFKKIELKKLDSLDEEQTKKLKELLNAADNHSEFKGLNLVKGKDYDKRRLIIMDNDEVVGFMTPSEYEREKGYWRAGAIFVDPSKQGQYYASSAIREFFSDKPGKVWISDKNKRSQRAFMRAGFKKGDPRKSGGDDGHDYFKELAPA